jgi:hypothetical protein
MIKEIKKMLNGSKLFCCEICEIERLCELTLKQISISSDPKIFDKFTKVVDFVRSSFLDVELGVCLKHIPDMIDLASTLNTNIEEQTNTRH